MQNNQNKEFTILNLGSGAKNPDTLKPYFGDKLIKEIRLDIDPKVNPDIVGSILDIPKENESVDAVFSSHCLEHLYYEEVDKAFSEMYRVLKPNGFAIVLVPDIKEVVKTIAKEDKDLDTILYVSPVGPISCMNVLYGLEKSVRNDKQRFMAHHFCFSSKILKNKFEENGFKDIIIEREFWGLNGFGRK